MLTDTYIAEFFEGEHAVVVSVSLNDGAVNELLKLHISEVSTHHHFKYSEKLTVRDEAVIVHIIDLESESKLLFAGCSGR